MKVTMLLADSAQAVGGKLYVLGGGWSTCGADPVPMGIALKIEVPWDRTNMRHTGKLELLDEDGAAVLVPTPIGDQPVQVPLDFEVGRPPGMKPGTPIDLALAINFPPLPIPPGHRYQWRLTLEGTSEDWSVGFTKLPPGQIPGMPGIPQA
jgi:hypothetical protein